MTKKHTGGCLCGAVRYEVTGPLSGIVACHCSQCRRTSGHFVAATSTPAAALRLLRSDSLAWYRSSEAAERGFCAKCGGNLFWRAIGGADISIMAGTLDTPTGLAMTEHIFVADKSDYYTIDDGLPQQPGWT
ncbi:MAG: GFA family protein [Steroidobacterales bacterium]